MKFNRKQAISLMKSEDFISDFENQLVPMSGWVILWKGKIVKSASGNSYYFQSEKSAIESLVRNISIYNKIERILAKDALGLDIPKDTRTSFAPSFREYFRHDLTWKSTGHGGYQYFSEEELNENDQKIRKTKTVELSNFESCCSNAIKVFIQDWIKQGLLIITKF